MGVAVTVSASQKLISLGPNKVAADMREMEHWIFGHLGGVFGCLRTYLWRN